MLKHIQRIFFALLLSLVLFACNLPAAAPASSEPPAAVPPVAVAAVIAFTATPTSTAVADVPVQNCSPIVTTNIVANVRSGPGLVYDVVGNLPLGGTAAVAGKSFDGTWWYIKFPGGTGYAWIAGSVTAATCIPTTLPVIAAPPAPLVQPAEPAKPGKPDPTDVPPTSSGPIGKLKPIGPIYLLLPSPTTPPCSSLLCKMPLKIIQP